jgi:hypothetical protein
MTFDQQLDRAFETLSGLIRAEVSRQVHAVGDELVAAVRNSSASDDANTARLAESIRAISSARSLSEILDRLVACAALEASRAGVLLVRGGRFHGWRFIGFGSSIDGGQQPIDISRAESGVLARTLDATAVLVAGPDGTVGAPAFAQLPAGRGCAAFPLTLGGHVVAVLYADAGAGVESTLRQGPAPSRGGTLNAEPLEVLARYAARSLEALTAFKAARSLAAGADTKYR